MEPHNMTSANQEAEYLRLLSIFHYVVAGFAALFACFPIFHFGIGIAAIINGLSQHDAGPQILIGLFFTIFAGTWMVTGWTFAVFVILAGRYLAKRIRYMFCLVVAGVECAFMPFGTVLGVFTIVVLTRPGVRERFQPPSAPSASPPPAPTAAPG
jgi:hypothetical protein